MRSGKVDGCLAAIIFLLCCIFAFISWSFTLEIDKRDYEAAALWSANPTEKMQKMLTDAAADGKISKWEYWWLSSQSEKEEEERKQEERKREFEEARKKSLETINTPK